MARLPSPLNPNPDPNPKPNPASNPGRTPCPHQVLEALVARRPAPLNFILLMRFSFRAEGLKVRVRVS